MNTQHFDLTPETTDRSNTDRARWTKRERYDPAWAGRSIEALAMIPDAKWLCDVGCGPFQRIRTLRPNAIYLPADLTAWSADTEICDINAGLLPVRSLKLCDVALFMGVLEYIVNTRKLFHSLAEISDRKTRGDET